MTQEKKEITNNFNDVSKNPGSIFFKIKYTAIPSNEKVHQEFTKFAYDEANNNYLSAINLLLKYKQIFSWFENFELRLTETESKMDYLRDILLQKSEEVKQTKEVKTF
jgi:hypothetical protein